MSFVCLFDLRLFGFVFPLGVSEGLRLVIEALPGLFSYLFLYTEQADRKQYLNHICCNIHDSKHRDEL